MILERFPEIMSLSIRERLQLMRELTDSLFVDVGEPDPDPELVAELNRRMELYRRDSSTGKPWPEVRRRIFGK